jgi:hypothetical protein
LITACSTDSVGDFARALASQAVTIRARNATNRITITLQAVNIIQVEEEESGGARLTPYANTILIAHTLTRLRIAHIVVVLERAHTRAYRITIAFLTCARRICQAPVASFTNVAGETLREAVTNTFARILIE